MNHTPVPPNSPLAVAAAATAGLLGSVAGTIYPLRAAVAHLLHPILTSAGRRGTVQAAEFGGPHIMLNATAFHRRTETTRDAAKKDEAGG